MVAGWTRKRVLIVVRTYPTPAKRGVEVSCTAGITSDSEWIRLYPIPYRSLDEDKQFTKYHWIEVDVTKAKGDTRPESYTPNLDSIKLGDKVPTGDGWRARRQLIQPLLRPSLCGIQKDRDGRGSPTLGIFKPAKITRLVIEPADADWSTEQREKLNQTLSLFDRAPAAQLEKIPFNFKYEFDCGDAECSGHSLSCTDWEAGQSYRKWRKQYGSDWQAAFRKKYEHEMINKFDTHFFVGNIHQYPNAWIIVGLFYPPRQTSGDLFD
jgi:hypothetical protein